MAVNTYYRIGKGTPVNFIGIKSGVSYFNNGSAVANAIVAIDDIPGQVDFQIPEAEVQDHHSQGTLVYQSYATKMNAGKLSIPSHPMKSGKLWRYVMGSAAHTSSYKHTFSEAQTFPYCVFHGEMEHTTTANSVRVDFLGNANERGVMVWSQDDVVQHSFDFLNSNCISSGVQDLSRPTGLDYKGNFMAGQNTVTLTYNSTTTNCDILGGSIEVTNTVKILKSGSKYPTNMMWVKKRYDIYLDAWLYNNTVLSIPKEPNDLAGAITLAAKLWRDSATTDYCNWSFTNLRLATKPYAQKIDEGEYWYHTRLHLTAAGRRSGISENKTTLVFVDDISGGKY